MISAPVGFQCPECVQAAEGNSRSPLTPVGGKVAKSAIVTKVIIGINVAFFIIEFIAGMDAVIFNFGMSPGAIAFGGEWYRLLTSAFLHGGLMHLAFNMLVLWFIGPPLEAIFGHVRFVVLYLLSALGGAVASFAFSPINTISVGASGAVFGLMAALIVAGHRLKKEITQVVVLLAINIAIGFFVPAIDWRAHLGGAAVGALVAAALAYAPKQSRILWQSLGVLAICAVLVAGLMVKAVSLQSQLPGRSVTAAEAVDPTERL